MADLRAAARALLLVLVATTLAQAAVAPPPAPAPTPAPPPSDLPITSSMTAGGMQMEVAATPGRPTVTHAIDGVLITYERITIAGDSLTSTSTPVPGSRTAMLDHARIDAGPKGPLPGRIRIDSSKTQLPEIGFRGVLTPASAFIDRLPIDPATPNLLRYQVRLNDLGAFQGEVKASGDSAGHAGAWQPIAGWADHAVLTIAMPLTRSGTAADRRRLESAVFYGTDPLHPAEIKELDSSAAPAGAGTPGSTLGAIDHPSVRSVRLTMRFSPNGDLDYDFGPAPVINGDFTLPTHARVH